DAFRGHEPGRSADGRRAGALDVPTRCHRFENGAVGRVGFTRCWPRTIHHGGNVVSIALKCAAAEQGFVGHHFVSGPAAALIAAPLSWPSYFWRPRAKHAAETPPL